MGEYPWFEAAFIGKGSGYLSNRYGGDSLVTGGSDLRIKLKALRFPVPGTLGVTVGSDVGRVWLEGEDSRRWHSAFGGGVFFEMFRGFSVFNLNVWRGEENTLFYFLSGFDF